MVMVIVVIESDARKKEDEYYRDKLLMFDVCEL
jgi:hypothetical protein